MNGPSHAFLPRDAAARMVRDALAPPGRIEEGPPGMGEVLPALVREPGGDILRRLEHPSFTTLEHLRRVGPPATGSWFNPAVSPSSPVQFELVAYTVPRGTQAWIFDYEWSVFRQSGIDSGDLVRAEPERFAASLGFDVTVDGARVGAIQYGLVPVPEPSARPSFASPAAARPAEVSAADFGGPAAQGLSLQPSRPIVAGARAAPFTLIANEGQRVVLTCVVFRRLRAAVAAIEGRIGGYLISTNVATALVHRLRPR